MASERREVTRTLRMTTNTDRLLDTLRGPMSRSAFIRQLIVTEGMRRRATASADEDQK